MGKQSSSLQLHASVLPRKQRPDAYTPYFDRWTDEEMANAAITLCRMTDKMLTSYIEKKDKEFVTQGGIRERMTAARLGRRQAQNEEIAALKARIAGLEAENVKLKKKLRDLGA